MNYKDIAVRAGKTFIQGALAFAVVNWATVQGRDTLKTFAVGAFAAGFSLAWNSVLAYKNQ